MLIGQNQPAAEQSAAVVDETVVDGGEHVYVQVGKFQLEKAHAAFVGFIEIDAIRTVKAKKRFEPMRFGI